MCEADQGWAGQYMTMEDLAQVSVKKGDPHEWSVEQVSTCLRSWGTGACFQSVSDQVLSEVRYG